MIKQEAIGLNSRQEANIYDENGMLPLMTAPMFSVVNEDNCKIFLDNGVRVCMPRNTGFDGELEYMQNEKVFASCSLHDFIKLFIDEYDPINDTTLKQCICIDVANGSMPALHEAIRKAKEIHGSNLIIMAGNVASEDAFVELAKTGVDYIRVGIGGGGGCNTTSNTGVGQIDLRQLIKMCKYAITINTSNWEAKSYIPELVSKPSYDIRNVKIVADGISSSIKQCEEKYGFNDNGYAAINTLLYAGADIVMIGKLFVQCLESAGEKGVETMDGVVSFDNWLTPFHISGAPKSLEELFNRGSKHCRVKYSGMSTLQEQEKYKDDKKPSEGSVQWIPIRWSLPDWLTGNDAQDSYPYLMGWVNSIKTVGSYTGNKTI